MVALPIIDNQKGITMKRPSWVYRDDNEDGVRKVGIQMRSNYPKSQIKYIEKTAKELKPGDEISIEGMIMTNGKFVRTAFQTSEGFAAQVMDLVLSRKARSDSWSQVLA